MTIHFNTPDTSSSTPVIAAWLLKLARLIDSVNTKIGQTLSWLCVLMAITVGIVVCLRAYGIGSIALQESVTYMHATLFLLCLAYTAKENGHVRVDIWYRKASRIKQTWIDVFGTILFQLPFAVFISVISWDMVMRSWADGEVSADPGGIPAVYLLKTLIPIAGALIALHSISDLIHKTLMLTYTQADETGGKA
ncbi:TRAP transporter small permease subunit [Teredinibacter sp. KSP-S5-2]|uniref:TRAP transporter small permease subunit n=1 Tax=Teredinibacter sp. KSP-S5-2 TaxID=3034506 RepID=UPI002934531E|nr:TRAP transporter small permease subunit [Teredinibacter sp. KSP-S5-2]WNO09081.1 TRAP transporter small permease subunit [Teredinibacter sp. KSP-S5-2]